MDKWIPMETERLILREYHLGDLEYVHEYAREPEVVQYLPFGPNTREATQEFLRLKLEEQNCWPRDEYTLAIVSKPEGRLIGGIRLGVRDAANRTADMGYVLHRRYWGQGYTLEAARALLDVAFGLLGLHRVWAACDVRNVASRRVLEKLGMRQEALFVKDVWQKGEWRTSYCFAVLEDEWRNRVF